MIPWNIQSIRGRDPPRHLGVLKAFLGRKSVPAIVNSPIWVLDKLKAIFVDLTEEATALSTDYILAL